MLLTTNDQTVLKMANLPPLKDLADLLNEFNDVFQMPKWLPPHKLHDHRIPLVDEPKVIKVKPYRYFPLQKVKIEKLVEEILQNGIIRNSNSPFALSVVMVKKKDRSWRLCVDYRQLNQVAIKDKYLIPLIEELLDELGTTLYFLS